MDLLIYWSEESSKDDFIKIINLYKNKKKKTKKIK